MNLFRFGVMASWADSVAAWPAFARRAEELLKIIVGDTGPAGSGAPLLASPVTAAITSLAAGLAGR
jgi:hypothetical protein